MSETASPCRVALALQGGGVHGAYSWGVIDRLLAEDIEIVAVSGTSAGALNGAALVAGLAEDGIEGARAALGRLWRNVARRSPMGVVHVPESWPLAPVVERLVEKWLETAKMTGRYFAPLLPGFQEMRALRSVVSDSIDVGRLGDPDAIPLHIAATCIRNGQPRIFDRGEITLDALMASACLPELFSAVEIDGERFWDGGYSANPALEPLVFDDGPVDHVLVVQVTPFEVGADLHTLPDVMRRTSDISFNACLMRDLKFLAEMKRLARSGSLEHERLKDIGIHLIEPPHTVAQGSKIDTRWSTIEQLHAQGHERMSRWLDAAPFAQGLRSAEEVVA